MAVVHICSICKTDYKRAKKHGVAYLEMPSKVSRNMNPTSNKQMVHGDLLICPNSSSRGEQKVLLITYSKYREKKIIFTLYFVSCTFVMAIRSTRSPGTF